MNQAPLALQLTGITKRFGSLTANDDISLTLRQGEDMGRPALLTVTLPTDDQGVRVSGNAARIG